MTYNITNNIINTSLNENSSIKHKINKHYPKRKKSRNTDYTFDNNQQYHKSKEVSFDNNITSNIIINNTKYQDHQYNRNNISLRDNYLESIIPEEYQAIHRNINSNQNIINNNRRVLTSNQDIINNNKNVINSNTKQ
jgi:hypothetical protein